MGLTVSYKNNVGTIVMGGDERHDIRITTIEGLGLCGREYSVATYSGYDGQETLSDRALPRTITMAVEICCNDAVLKLKSMLGVLNQSGTLFVKEGSVCRRIYCNQVTTAEGERILKGRIIKLVLQFVCDNPYFEDEEDTDVALYDRRKLLQSPFSLPSMFGQIILGTEIIISGHRNVEPIITLRCPSGSDAGSYIFIKNESTGATIHLEYSPCEKDEIMTAFANFRGQRYYETCFDIPKWIKDNSNYENRNHNTLL